MRIKTHFLYVADTLEAPDSLPCISVDEKRFKDSSAKGKQVAVRRELDAVGTRPGRRIVQAGIRDRARSAVEVEQGEVQVIVVAVEPVVRRQRQSG